MVCCRYRVGIDVGLNSVGLAAIEVDDGDRPIRVLNLETIIHDGGVDPNANKTAGTRKAVSGSARRMRRLIRRRRARLEDLDCVLRELGYPLVDLEREADSRYPWAARRELVTTQVEDEGRLRELVSVAIRHMARHRGWRNPYRTVASLKQETEPSKEFLTLIKTVEEKLARPVDPTLTVAEIVDLGLKTDLNRKLRGQERKGKDGQTRSSLLESKIHQSDNVRELRRIWEIQGLPRAQFDRLVDAVFQARSPKGSAIARVGRDPLDKAQPRAEKASLAFQRYRIVSLVANLRVREGSGERALSAGERTAITGFLWESRDEPAWADVAEQIGLGRSQLRGTAKETDDGERASARPPVNVTDRRVRDAKIKELTQWWDEADEAEREAMIEVISNGSGSGATPEAIDRAQEFVSTLPEEVMGKLDNVKLPEGRSAYSAKTLRRLTAHMLPTEDDLHAARKAVFGVADDWRPPSDPIGLPVGNPAVDRVLKIVARWLAAVEREWGPPLSVNIEHTRDGLMSERQAREIDRANNQRFARNLEMKGEIADYLADHRRTIARGDDDSFDETSDSPLDAPSMRDVDRWRAFTRQDGKCLYCGTALVYPAFEMDHIVPRAGQGATNTQVNLAAVCRDCNHSKGKQPFAVWARSGVRPQVDLESAIDRAKGLRFFGVEDRDKRYQYRFRGDVIDRLRRTDLDDEIDARSIESVGWMANELHHRVEAHYRDQLKASTDVRVFRGWITSEARKAAGIDKRFLLIGGQPGKNRLDRRHHAVDAATIALLRPGVAQVLAVRDNLRKTNRIDPQAEVDWKDYRGTDTALFQAWTDHMVTLADLVQDHLDADRVPVFEFLRLKLGSSKGHEDTIRPTLKRRLADELPVELIDRSATPQQWVALTQAPGFDLATGLPADESRHLRVKNRHLGPDDEIEFFPTGAGCIATQGGYAELGSAFHHARIYRCTKTLKSGRVSTFYAMMRVYQVDLLGGANDNLFTWPIPPQTMSFRAAEDRLRTALISGDAEYIGWVVPGDELLLDMSTQVGHGQVGEFLQLFPGVSRWVVGGFFMTSVLRLYPRGLASEGLPDDVPASVGTLMKSGWKPSVDPVFGACHATVVRRDVLGRPRLTSTVGLPVTWTTVVSEV
jgi:CRISPR-associated endonuclease Csn1